MIRGTAKSYRVFVRNWWRHAGPGETGLIPDPTARKATIARGCTEEEARQICEEYAKKHRPGILSRKAEYELED